MPLAFESLSHGTIAFGFFHIEVDLLVLSDLFFFADDFCAAATSITGKRADAARFEVDGWQIRGPGRAGNLHGAIAGIDHSGFIGALYRDRPFPARPEDFKQSPEGERNRDWARDEIARFGEPARIDFVRGASSSVAVGEYEFDAAGFEALVHYVERGGYPRWRNDEPPGYVREMSRRRNL